MGRAHRTHEDAIVTEHNPDRIVLWPGYFNSKLSRKQGRRVAKKASVADPTLDGLALAARNVGLSKMKREADTPHPKRPSAKEGRLWISKRDAESSLGFSGKEQVMQAIGGKWRSSVKELKAQEKAAKKSGPKAGDKRGRAQRKQVKAKGSKKKKQKWRV